MTRFSVQYTFCGDLPGGSGVENLAAMQEALGSIPELGRLPGEGKDYPLQYSCLENLMDRGAWRATVRGVAKSQTRLRDSITILFVAKQQLLKAEIKICFFFVV